METEVCECAKKKNQPAKQQSKQTTTKKNQELS